MHRGEALAYGAFSGACQDADKLTLQRKIIETARRAVEAALARAAAHARTGSESHAPAFAASTLRHGMCSRK